MNIAVTSAMFAHMVDLREQQLAWLENVVTSTGLTLTDVAKRANLNPSTLTRFRAKDIDGHTLTARTVQKIENATGIPAYEIRPHSRAITPSPMVMLNETEATPYIISETSDDMMVEALRIVTRQSSNVDLWQLKTGTLAAIGFNEGDVILVDRGAQPRPGDAVCAQRYDWRRGTAETIFRVYRKPYLMTAAMFGEPAIPEVLDDENVVIKGVVIGGCHLRK